MAFQNRVNPFGDIVTTKSRGNLMGNRGCLHNAHQTIIKNHQLKRWIICVLEFKNRRRDIMAPGRYTELFFWDEATALASGHRPCAECQRQKFNHFKQSWMLANGHTKISTPDMDKVLHTERTALSETVMPCRNLPDGVMIAHDGLPYLVFGNQIFLWTFDGYGATKTLIPHTQVYVLTPLSIVATLRHGYSVDIRF